jgi:hypothetical protein
LANWFPWLPDAAVVRVAQLLTGQPTVPRTELRNRLLSAAAAGIPVYTDSLNWLYRGLILLAREAPGDMDVREALDGVRPYADACDWGSALTTFAGRSPGAPTFEAVLLPERPDDWVDLGMR